MKKITKQYSGKSVQDLEKEELSLRKELSKLNLESKVSQPKDTNTIMKTRKKLAVVLTVMGMKKEEKK